MKRLLLLALVVACCAARVSATTITVTNLADFDPGSLYQAVFEANTSPPPVVIKFNYTGAPPFIIRYTNSFLPYLTNEVSIDGSSQPGYTGSTPVIWLDGSGVTSPANFGILVQGGNSTIRAIRVSGFTSTGIILSDKDGNTVVGCWIVSNQQGITVNTSSNIIGGTTASNRNIIGGNIFSGIRVSGPSSGNKILGNYIGLNPTNITQGMTNGEHGIYIVDGADILVAGTSTARQVISSSGQNGITISGSGASNVVVVGNHIGVALDGATIMSNGQNGVYMPFAGAGNRIGGTNASDANVISGNGSRGVYVWAASDTVIQGNKIGTSSNGLAAVPNFASGITISDAPDTLIGGGGAGAGNVISGNRLDGIQLFGSTGPVTIQGNLVGLTTGGSVVSNGGSGIYVGGAPGTLVGGSNVNERNSVGGNGFEGIYLAFCSNVTVQGNLVGLDFLGLRRANGMNGILVGAATDCRIGGTNAGARNIVSANFSSGIFIDNGAARNRVEGNWVGLNLTGASALSNGYKGVRIRDSTNNLIGGSAPGAGNVIAGNSSDQVVIEAESVSNTVAGNFIGLAANGTTAVPGGLGTAGVIVNAPYTTIGGTSAGERNVIAGNASYGVFVFGCSNATIQGNYIGFASNGVTFVTNGDYGVDINLGAAGAVVGGTAPGARNVIAGSYYGVWIQNAVSNSLVGNWIGLAANATSVVTNVQYAVWVQSGSYNNIGGSNEGEGNAIFSKVLGVTMVTTNTHHNTIQGNLLNLSPAGNLVSSNCGSGISLTDSPSNTIGGASDNARNVLTANGNGIQLTGSNTTGNIIQGNYISVGPDGFSPRALTNVAGNGIQIQNATRNLIGGTNAGAGNIIAYRTTGGISLSGTNATGNAIFGNCIYSNGQLAFLTLAIDLNSDGVTANDNVFDGDGGPNSLQNFPVITNAITLLGSTRVQGYLASAASRNYRIEFFAADVNFQEGRLYLGATNIATAANGTGVFAAVLNGYAATSRWITATATDSSNNTSELSTPFKPSLAPDTDGDKMPDFWESQYGLNPNASNAVTADADSDGVPDIEEYVAATIPNSATSHLALLEFDPGTNASVTIPTSPFRIYNLESSTNLLLASAWRIAVTNALGTGLDRQLIDAQPNSNGAYRVRVFVP